MKPLLLPLTILTTLLLHACESRKEDMMSRSYPKELGFDDATSEPAAIELADSILAAMGGAAAWDEIKVISWNADNTILAWNRVANLVRAEMDTAILLLDLKTRSGRVSVNNEEILKSDVAAPYIQKAYRLWNDEASALLIPLRLKQRGAVLQYMGESLLSDSGKCNLLQLTFTDSKQKYMLYVDLKDNLIKQCQYFESTDQQPPSKVYPFKNYQNFGVVRLSISKEKKQQVKLFKTIPSKMFTDLEHEANP